MYARDAMAAAREGTPAKKKKPLRQSISVPPRRRSAPTRPTDDIRGFEVDSRTDYPTGDSAVRFTSQGQNDEPGTDYSDGRWFAGQGHDDNPRTDYSDRVPPQLQLKPIRMACDDKEAGQSSSMKNEDPGDDEESIGEVPCAPMQDDGDGGAHRADPMKKDTVDFSSSMDDTTISAALSSYGPPTSGDDEAAIQEEFPLF